MIRYANRTVRIGGKLDDLDSKLDNELNYIYSDFDVVNMTITPIIENHEGFRIVVEYWIVYVYKYEENEC